MKRLAATAGDIMTPLLEVVTEDDTVTDAAMLMVELNLPAVPVVDRERRLRGMLSNREVVEVLGWGRDPGQTSAGEIARPATTVRIEEPLTSVGTAFEDRPGRLLAVIDGQALVGLINRRDLEGYLRAVDELGSNASNLVLEASPRELVGPRSRGAHLMAGASALSCVRHAMSAAGKQRVTSALDFACGYGRVLRMLKAAFPSARLAGGDIDREAVDFCAATFGSDAIYSREDPADVRIDGTFDLVWCGSLLTHVDSERWSGFLALLESCLSPGGLLVFTAHSERDEETLRRFGLTRDQTRRILRDYADSGFGYVDYETQRNWGIALASPQWVRSELDKRPSLELVSYEERSWDAPAPRQDVYACVS